MKSKYEGIDQREIKCCDTNHKTIEAGISFDQEDANTMILRFHFLDYITKGNGEKILHQQTKSMWLDKENTKQLIQSLKELKFKKS